MPAAAGSAAGVPVPVPGAGTGDDAVPLSDAPTAVAVRDVEAPTALIADMATTDTKASKSVYSTTEAPACVNLRCRFLPM